MRIAIQWNWNFSTMAVKRKTPNQLIADVPEVLNVFVNETNKKNLLFQKDLFFQAVKNEFLRKKMWFYLILFLIFSIKL